MTPKIVLSVDLAKSDAGAAPPSGTANQVDGQDTRTAWLTRRRQGIGASDVSGILGLSPWASPFSVWADKVGLSPLDDDATEAQEFGLMAEPMLKQYFENKTGRVIYGQQAVHTHTEHPWMMCTVDGLVEADELEVYEAKTTSDPPSEWARDGVPLHYQCQATWSMAVTGAHRVWFGVLHLAFGRPQFRVYEFVRDDQDLAHVVETVTAFWNNHVITGEMPATDGHPATVDAVNSAWTADPKGVVEAGEFGRALFDELTDRKAAAKELADEIDALEVAIKVAMRTNTALVDGTDAKGKPLTLATWNAQDDTRIDIGELRATLPDVAAAYTKTTTRRVLRLKAVK